MRRVWLLKCRSAPLVSSILSTTVVLPEISGLIVSFVGMTNPLSILECADIVNICAVAMLVKHLVMLTIGNKIRNFRHFCPTKNFVHWKIVLFLKSRQWALNRSFTVTFIYKKNLDNIFVRLNFSLENFFVTSKKFRHFILTKFSPIRYITRPKSSIVLDGDWISFYWLWFPDCAGDRSECLEFELIPPWSVPLLTCRPVHPNALEKIEVPTLFLWILMELDL